MALPQITALRRFVQREGLQRLLRNRYVVVGVLAVVWMLLFDRYDVGVHWRLQRKINQLESDRTFYQSEIIRLKAERRLLQTSRAEAERLAREQYLMKRTDEDLYIVVPVDR